MKKLIYLLMFLACITATHAAEMPAPEKEEVLLRELRQKRTELDGKIVEVEISNILSFKKVSPGLYRANDVSNSDTPGVNRDSFQGLYFPEEALEYITHREKDKMHSSKETMYILVNANGPQQFTAVGLRYRKSKKRYKW